MLTSFIPWIIAAYLVGTIPFGLLIGLARGVDIRNHGSGNIGATNAGRVLGKKLGIVCFVLDFFKGFLPTLCAGLATHMTTRTGITPGESAAWLAVAIAAILGHVFPIWLKFKGGKGVATGAGAMVALYPVLTIAAGGALLVWILCAAITRYVSLSSCIAALSLPFLAAGYGSLAAWRRGQPPASGIDWVLVGGTVALSALVLWTHRGNMSRLRAGTERRLGQPKPGDAAAKPAA